VQYAKAAVREQWVRGRLLVKLLHLRAGVSHFFSDASTPYLGWE
jgi:hypothetical protein